MSSVPDGTKTTVVRRRRRRREKSGWKAIPNAAKILIGLCLLVLILFPVAQSNGWFKRRVKEKPLADVRPADLVLAEASFEARSRTLRGLIRNNSGTAYKDVVVSYTLKGAQGLEVGTILASISKLGPHEKAPFETDPMPKNAVIYELREIVGTPR